MSKSAFLKIQCFSSIIIFGLIYVSCGQSSENIPKSVFITVYSNGQDTFNLNDTIQNLLTQTSFDKEINYDYFGDCFFHFESGYILNKNSKNAIIVHGSMDSNYTLIIYTEIDTKWSKDYEIKKLDCNPVNFELDFRDYNFDGQTDIYFQTIVYNGFAKSGGHLLIIDTEEQKIVYHPECDNLFNMRPDSTTKLVYSEDNFYCTERAFNTTTNLTNKWINNKLVTISQDDPCNE